jgi:AP endonuclease 2
MVCNGERLQSWTSKNLLPTSGRLIPEFDRRRNIKDMFSKKPSFGDLSSFNASPNLASQPMPSSVSEHSPAPMPSIPSGASSQPKIAQKRSQEVPLAPSKRVKSASQPANNSTAKGQKSLKGFFASKASSNPASQSDGTDEHESFTKEDSLNHPETVFSAIEKVDDLMTSPIRSQNTESDKFVDPIASKDSWGKLFVKPAAPRCEHAEPCKTMLTKKTGLNCGRSFWMCARPLGPSGSKEKGTQWRCSTFIWASDWNGVG